ncbi:hypothetical protein [Pseudonocardia charpentierae]|uniref:Uncharacterized protein n=1 Tax=Pseudonocardia charpentierae TaxID=3075545 RepID=A0ABU2NJ02_9PSEU|nr:hypothetical protein [Pseudonocardia sp. DSM 45834]MDT0353951.1 hypothetical protein [Pseudonocardia sp. DSM 45834]
MPVNPDWQRFVTLCQRPPTASGPGLVVLTNISNWALRVHSPSGGVRVQPRRASASLSDGFTDELMSRATPDPVDCSVPVGPGASAVYPASVALSVGVGFDLRYTGGRYLTDAAAKWIEGKATPRGRAAAESVAACAESGGGLLSTSRTGTTLEEVLGRAIEAGGSCRSMVKTLQELADAPQPTTVADELKSVTKGIGTSIWDDVAKYGPRAAVNLAKAI